MHALRIIALAVAVAIVYGIAMDNVTARVCVEYFTIAHPRVIDSESPTTLAFTWGVLATWWVGLLLGIPLAACARAGRPPKLAARDLVHPVAMLLVAMAVITAAAGVIAYALARGGRFFLAEPWASYIPIEKHHAFLADGAAHLAAYAAGFLGGIVLCVYTVRRRLRSPQQAAAADGSHTTVANPTP